MRQIGGLRTEHWICLTCFQQVLVRQVLFLVIFVFLGLFFLWPRDLMSYHLHFDPFRVHVTHLISERGSRGHHHHRMVFT